MMLAKILHPSLRVGLESPLFATAQKEETSYFLESVHNWLEGIVGGLFFMLSCGVTKLLSTRRFHTTSSRSTVATLLNMTTKHSARETLILTKL